MALILEKGLCRWWGMSMNENFLSFPFRLSMIWSPWGSLVLVGQLSRSPNGVESFTVI